MPNSCDNKCSNLRLYMIRYVFMQKPIMAAERPMFKIKNYSRDMTTRFRGFSVCIAESGKVSIGRSKTPMNCVRWFPGLSCSPVNVYK